MNVVYIKYIKTSMGLFPVNTPPTSFTAQSNVLDKNVVKPFSM